MAHAQSAFEAALDELGVTVTYAQPSAVEAAVQEAIVTPAVGVALGDRFEDTGFELAESAVAVDPTPAELRAATTGVTSADLGIGDYGSLVLTMDEQGSELVSLFVDHHVAILHESDLRSEMDTAIAELDDRITESGGSSIIATGPSATADMGALVQGAHGPETVNVIVVEEVS